MIDSLDALNSLTNTKNIVDYKRQLKNYHNQVKYTSLYFKYFDEEDPKKINTKQSYYLEFAATVALNSNMFQKHGAIIVYKKNTIGTGYNTYTNNKNNFSNHAEVNCINNVIKKYGKSILNECELYVVRIGPPCTNNIFKYSKPCINCQKVINKFNIKKIYYSTNYEYDKLICDNFL